MQHQTSGFVNHVVTSLDRSEEGSGQFTLHCPSASKAAGHWASLVATNLAESATKGSLPGVDSRRPSSEIRFQVEFEDFFSLAHFECVSTDCPALLQVACLLSPFQDQFLQVDNKR
ncbi:unnamed protein product [Sphagnum balticum]